MKIEINKDGIRVCVEGEKVSQETINGVIEAVYGKPRQVHVEMSGVNLIAHLNRTNRSNPDPEKGAFAKGGILEGPPINAII